MKMKHIGLGIFTTAALLMSVATRANAQVIISDTWISGTVLNGSTPVAGGTVTVQCNSSTRFAGIQSNGTYAVSFPQTECKAGDFVTASASTGEGSGSNSASVTNSPVNGPIVDLDIAVVDINVPEFGVVGGAMTAIMAAGSYLYLRAKSLV